jgi:patatin-like phospholipase/acyl hydrolase
MLQRIMDAAYPGKKPCEVFDLIGGTSTGGFIAIMLGRLEMTVADCITSYTKFMGEVFPQSIVTRKMGGIRTFFKVAVGGEKWDSNVLEEVIKRLIQERLNQDPETVLLQDKNNPNPKCKV